MASALEQILSCPYCVMNYEYGPHDKDTACKYNFQSKAGAVHPPVCEAWRGKDMAYCVKKG